jgi:ribosome-associated toxin RatA of RatAB toxin-antitoxin module
MPAITREEVFPFSADRIHAVLVDYEQYPKFVDGVDDLVIIEKDDVYTKARYSLNLIKKFEYILELKENPGKGLSWHFLEGQIFKKNSGSWVLEPIDDQSTKVIYSLEVEFKLFAPKKIISKLVEQNLPNMMKAFKEQIEKA